MENKNYTELSSLGEFGLIDHLTRHIELKNKSTLKGVGDDAAVLDYGEKKILMSTDMLIQGIHFDLTYTPLKSLPEFPPALRSYIPEVYVRPPQS